MGGTLQDRFDSRVRLKINDDGSINVVLVAPIVIAPGDIEIGAVEIKDGVTDDRASVDMDGSVHAKIFNGAGVSAVNVQDGGNSLTVDGTVTAEQGGLWNINNISGTIVLPTGAATESTLNDIETDVDTITGSIIAGIVQTNITNASLAITAASLPLPTGAATETTLNDIETDIDTLVAVDFATSAKQDTGNTSLATIAAKDFATQTTLALIKAKTDNLDVLLSTRTKPADTQIVSGTVGTKTPLTASAPTSASVTTTSATVVAANGSRKGLVLINLSSTKNISFGIGATAVNGSGIVLTPNGVWVMDEYNFTTAAINAVTTLTTSALAIQEFT